MTEWLSENIGTIAVSFVLAAVLACIVVKLVRDRRKGKASCGANCAHCAMAGQCHH